MRGVSCRTNAFDVHLADMRRTICVGLLICSFFAVVPKLPRLVAPAVGRLGARALGTIVDTQTELSDEMCRTAAVEHDYGWRLLPCDGTTSISGLSLKCDRTTCASSVVCVVQPLNECPGSGPRHHAAFRMRFLRLSYDSFGRGARTGGNSFGVCCLFLHRG